MISETYDPALMRGARYMREDTLLVLLDRDPIQWASAEGGAVFDRYRDQYETLTLTRPHSSETAPLIQHLVRRVGQRATVRIEHLSGDGDRTGIAWEYEGRIKSFHPPEADANHAAVAHDRLVLQPTTLRYVGQPG